MKKLLSLTIFSALAAQANAGTESVAPNQPVFVPPLVQAPPPVRGGGAGAGAPTGTDAGAGAPSGTGADAGAIAGAASQQGAAQAQAVAARISSQIATAQLFCARVSFAEYRIDCLSDQLAQVAATIPATPDFAEAREIVRNTSTKLATVARSKRSTTKRPANLSSAPTNQRSSRPIVPVETVDLPEAIVEAEAIIDEAETLLLRASETSERRKVAYEDIAEAVGSTKLLLRSS